MRSSKRRLLYVCTYDPGRQDLGGGGWTDRALLKLLRDEYEITLATVTGDAGRGAQADCHVLSEVPLSVRGSRRAMAKTLAHMVTHGDPYLASKYRTWRSAWESGSAALRARVRESDLVVTNGWPALLLAHDAGICPALHVAQNVESLVAAEHSPRVLKVMREELRLRKLELDLLSYPDSVAVLSLSDAAFLQGHGIKATALTLPLRDKAVAKSKPVLTVGFIGTQTWPPNQQGLRLLMDEILPTMQRDDEVAVVLAGRGTEIYADRPGVQRAGFIQDEADFFQAIDLQIVPRPGVVTGISVKLLEGTEYGVQSIASTKLIASHPGTTPWLRADGLAGMLERLIEFREHQDDLQARLAAYRNEVGNRVESETRPLLRELSD